MSMVGFTDNRPHEGSFVVYLNGIEVPVQAIEVSMGVNVNPSAVLSMVPDPIISRLGAEDRIEVAAFYLDDIYPALDRKGGAPDFRLLYEGEIIGRSYTNTATGRRIGFNSVNFLKILYDLYPYFITGPESLTMEIANPPQGNDASVVTNPMCFPWNRFFYGFDQQEEKLIRRPYDLIVNVLNSVVGVKEQKLLGSSVATNFFARYMARVGFVNRFVPSPLIETDIMSQDEEQGVFPILRAVRDSQVVETLARGAAEPGMGSPIWPTIQQMFLRMYYEVLTITTAPIAQVNRTPDSPDNGVIMGPPVFKLTEDTGKKAQRDADETAYLSGQAYKLALGEIERMSVPAENYDSVLQQLTDGFLTDLKKTSIQEPAVPTTPNCLLNYVTKPQWLFGVAPSCNVVFPSMLQEMRFEEDYSSQPTRLYINDMWLAELTGTGNETQKALATLRAGYPDQVQRELDKRYGISDAGVSADVRVSGKNFLVWPEEFYRGPQPASISLPNWFTMLAQFVQTRQSKEQQQAANALRELKATSAVGGDVQAKIQEFVDAGVLPAQVIASTEYKLTKKGKQVVMEEKEKVYSITKVEEILTSRASDQNAAMSTLRRGYARYEYYRQRANCRSGAAIMTFNPYIVPGFPTFIFDDVGTGEHIVAYIVSVTHSMSKDSWSTQVTFTSAMTLDEYMQELFDARVGNTAFGVIPDQASAPVNPIESLRAVLQVQERAEDYFSLLFHQRGDYPGVKSCAFDFTKAVELVVPSGESYLFSTIFEEEAVIQAAAKRKAEAEEAKQEVVAKVAAYRKALESEALTEFASGLAQSHASSSTVRAGLSTADQRIASRLSANRKTNIQKELDNKVANYERNQLDEYEKRYGEQQATAPKPKVPSDLLQKYVAVKPSVAFSAMFRNHDNAMRFVSRPICTLDEYIAFRGRRGTKSGTVSPSDSVQGKGGVFYEKILNLVQGPGDPPTFDENNNLLTPAIADLPDTRADWETRLKIYRQRVLFKRAGWRPDGEGKK